MYYVLYYQNITIQLNEHLCGTYCKHYKDYKVGLFIVWLLFWNCIGYVYCIESVLLIPEVQLYKSPTRGRLQPVFTSELYCCHWKSLYIPQCLISGMKRIRVQIKLEFNLNIKP